MRNVLAIAQRELKSYFASPIAFVVIGFFAFVIGWFYVSVLNYFLQLSMMSGMQQMGPQTVNVNQQMLRPLFLNMAVVFLFVLPMITMRTYSEEKRSGTIELLLTSPVTDLEIILGKFVGAMTMFCAMLATSLVHVGLLFWFGKPEWQPVATSYLGLVLVGGCFIAVGMLISSMTKSQTIAGMVTFVVFLMLWVIDWLGQAAGPRGEAILSFLSITGHLEDFLKGVIDTKHLVYYLSFIGFGLFLTARSVDSERWRG
jgi:ABC-2 type transport system permease protein